MLFFSVCPQYYWHKTNKKSGRERGKKAGFWHRNDTWKMFLLRCRCTKKLEGRCRTKSKKNTFIIIDKHANILRRFSTRLLKCWTCLHRAFFQTVIVTAFNLDCSLFSKKCIKVAPKHLKHFSSKHFGVQFTESLSHVQTGSKMYAKFICTIFSQKPKL